MKIKHILFSAVAVAVLIGSGCKKSETTSPTNTPDDPLAEVGAVPTSFTQKVVLEKFTGEWCVNCPSGAAYLKAVMDAHPNTAYGVEVHQNDWLELTQLTTLETHLGGVAGYPRAAINRVPAQGTGSANQDGFIVYSRGSWEANAARLLQNTASTGLAISTKVNGDNLDIKVFASSLQPITKDTRLTVYILENNIVARNQTGGSPGYTHQHVLRKVVSAGLGDVLELKTAGGYITKEYKGVSLVGFDKANIHVLAFINVVGANSNSHEILNAQEVKAGEAKKWN